MIIHRSRRSSTRRNTPPPPPATTLHHPPHNTHLLLIITTATTIVVAIRRLTLMGMSTVVSMAQLATLHPITHLHLITTASTHLRHPTIQTRQLQQVAATITTHRLTTVAMATLHRRRLSVPLAAEASEERAAMSMAMMEAIDSHGWCGRQTRIV